MSKCSRLARVKPCAVNCYLVAFEGGCSELQVWSTNIRIEQVVDEIRKNNPMKAFELSIVKVGLFELKAGGEKAYVDDLVVDQNQQVNSLGGYTLLQRTEEGWSKKNKH